MELLDGESLADRIRRGPLDLDSVLTLGVQIVDALESAHSRGIVHRDLKPANIFVDLALAGKDPRFRPGEDGSSQPTKQFFDDANRSFGRSNLWPARQWEQSRTCRLNRRVEKSPMYARTFFHWHRSLSDGGRHTPVQGRNFSSYVRLDFESRPDATERSQSVAASRTEPNHRTGAGEGSRPALSERH